jgi:MFS family permease
MKLRVVLSAVLVLILALGFNAILNLTSVNEQRVEALMAKCTVIAVDLQRKIESSDCFSMDSTRLCDLNRALEREREEILAILAPEDLPGKTVLESSEPDVSISVSLADGSIHTSTDKEALQTFLPQPIPAGQTSAKHTVDTSSEVDHFQINGNHLLTVPIHNAQRERTATATIYLPAARVNGNPVNALSENLKLFVVVFLVGALLLVMVAHFLVPHSFEGWKSSKIKVSAAICLVIGCSQFTYSALTGYSISRQSQKYFRDTAGLLAVLIKEDIGKLIIKGIPINNNTDIELSLKSIIKSFHEVDAICLSDVNQDLLYSASREALFDGDKTSYGNHRSNHAVNSVLLQDGTINIDLWQNGMLNGLISIQLSTHKYYDGLSNTLKNSITTLALSMLLFVELLILLFIFVEKQAHAYVDSPKLHYKAMRPAAFLLLFGIDISVSFLPLHMENLYQPILGLSKSVIMGLPISAEFFLAGVAILIGGAWLDRRGWHEPFFCGLIAAGFGILYSWLAVNAVHFVISRALVGLGYGLSLIASQGFVISFTDERGKAQGLAYLFAGIYAGSICGGATGAMLAERMGYGPVFLIGAMILGVVLIYALIFLRNGIKKPEAFYAGKAIPAEADSQICHFLKDRNIVGLIFFSSLPASIAVVGFLNYFSPIYLKHIGASQSTIGQIMMIYGICLIYVGPIFSKSIDASSHKKFFIFLGAIVGSLAFLVFRVADGLAAAALAMFFLGLSSSLVLASQSAYALELKVTQDLGAGKAIGIFRSTGRIGQTLGPMLFGWLTVAMNLNDGITYFGLAYLVTALLFLLVTGREAKVALVEVRL